MATWNQGWGPSPLISIFVVSTLGSTDPSVSIAASRAGEVGLLDLTLASDVTSAVEAVGRLRALSRGRFGLLLSSALDPLGTAALQAIGPCDTILLVHGHEGDLAGAAARCRAVAQRVGLVVTSEVEAMLAARLGLDLVVAKGHEAGGFVGEETAFVLCQRLLAWGRLPVCVWGGIGAGTAAACRVAGAAGVVLDGQLALMRESPLPGALRARLESMDGSETQALRCGDGRYLRLLASPEFTAKDRLAEPAPATHGSAEGNGAARASFEERVKSLLREPRLHDRPWLVGQDGAFAAAWAARSPTVAGALKALRDEVEGLVERASRARSLDREAPLAVSHGTEFPIVQGPMTRVSDVPGFSEAVADGGALSFLALALMRGPEVRRLLEETRDRMGPRPWGVGILGFVDRATREEQMAALAEVRPPFAIIAGGRPDQAAGLQARGITTYLHVPSPGMLDMFLREGARRFIFEGRECGGHVGPRTSFVLWELMQRVLLSADLPPEELAQVHVLFAGGVHDGLSAAMVAALAQPLVDRGAKIGVLVGTGYLFTREAVSTGAIVQGFQDVVLEASHTVLVESGPGHSIRCADTEYAAYFESTRGTLREQGRSLEEIRDELERMNQGRLRIASKGIVRIDDPDRPFAHLEEAEQRRQGMYMVGQVAALCRRVMSVRELHEQISFGACERLGALAQRAAPRTVRRPEAPPPLDVAVVGLGCLLPGALDVTTYWRNILAGRDVVGEVPAERFDAERWFDPDRSARDRICSRAGGFLPPVPFDPLRFGIPPAVVPSIEPAQLLALQVVDQALRDARWDSGDPARRRASVIFGASGGMGELALGYAFRSLLPHYLKTIDPRLLERLPEWTEDSFPGTLLNVIAGRVSNRFDLGGVNYTVDAACASSLAALHLACRELAAGTSDMVVAGGCETLQNPFAYLCFSKTGALSARGRSRTFDASADGIAISEGLAAVVLKRREDAERDGDRIYALIRAVAGGSDGRSKSLTAPAVEGQLRTLERAYEQARFSPATIGLFEAHGTGTAIGDQTECQSLIALLRRHPPPDASIPIGSVKSMIGHTKSTAGLASLIKVALALHERVRPPTLHVEMPHPKAGLTEGLLHVSDRTLPWIAGDAPRRAGVSSFGFGGTNFHAVLEEYRDAVPQERWRAPRRPRVAELFLLSAPTPAALASRAAALRSEAERLLREEPAADLAALAASHARRQAQHEVQRAAVLAGSLEELTSRLASLAASLRSGTAAGEGVFTATAALAAGGPIAFLFPGQGSQFVDMLADVALEFTEVRETLERAEGALRGGLSRPLTRSIFPAAAFTAEERQAQADELKATEIAQPALGACDVAMLRLLASFGVRPAMTAGHSYGELVALHAAGALSEDDLYRLSWARGEAMAGIARASPGTDLGSMMAVQADESATRDALDGCAETWIANLNGPRQTIVSGTAAGLLAAARRCTAARLSQAPVAVSCAFHSPLMEPARERFAQALEGVALTGPVLPVYSNTTAAAYPAEPAAVRQLLARHITERVRFAEQIEAMYAAGATVFVEVGPQRVLSRLVDDILGDRPHLAVPTHLRGGDGVVQLLTALARLHVHGAAVDLERLHAGREPALPPSASRPATWILNGGYSRRSHEPERRPEALELAPAATPAPGLLPSAEQMLPAMTPARPDEPASDDDHALRQYQEVMRQFLQTQQAVMEAYLRAGQEAARPSSVTPAPLQLPLTLPPRAEPVAPAIEIRPLPEPERSNGAAAVAPPSEEQLRERLLATVSERTGYPPDMLGLDANLEADLGIDSIKRVEIIGVFRRAACPAVQQPPAWFMERMTAATSLRQILAGVSQLLHDGSPAAAPAPPEPERSNGAAAVAPPSEEQLRERLLATVSERTGYPPDMLGLDANLEADLGIDSIKRVEIIGVFRRAACPAVQQPPAWFMERMTAATSLRQILAGVSQLLHDGSPAAPDTDRAVEQRVAHAPPSAVLPPDCPRFVAQAVERPLPSTPGPLPSGVIIVTDDGHGLARNVAHMIREAGGRAGLLDAGQLGGREDADVAVGRVRDAHGPIGGVLHLLPLQDAPAFPDIDPAEWTRLAALEVKGLLFLLQALAPELRVSAPVIVSASLDGGDFAPIPGEASRPWRGGLVGLLKTAAHEWPRATFRAVDFDERPAPATLLAELGGTGPVEIGWRMGRRFALAAVAKPLSSSGPPALQLDQESVVLATGGARGITAEVIDEIARHTRASLVLLGRSALPAGEEDPSTAELADPAALRAALIAQGRSLGSVQPREIEDRLRHLLDEREMRSRLAKLRSTGSHVEYVSCDARDGKALANLIGDVRRRYGRIDLILHGAGVIEDRMLLDKTATSFDRVMGTKVDPLLGMARVLDDRRLQALVIFSSVAGFHGNAGQADYAAASETVNRMARRLNDLYGARVVALNWGPWQGAGSMVSPDIARQFADKGIGLVAVASGRAAAWRELLHGPREAVRVVLGSGPWARDLPAAGQAPVVGLAAHAELG